MPKIHKQWYHELLDMARNIKGSDLTEMYKQIFTIVSINNSHKSPNNVLTTSFTNLFVLFNLFHDLHGSH